MVKTAAERNRAVNPDPILVPIQSWFERRGWSPLPFQQRSWAAYLEGRSGLIQVPTGSGKTFAAVMGPIAAMLAETEDHPGIRLLYITPLRALSRDLALAIREPICLLYTSPSPRDGLLSRMPSSA